MLWAIKHLSLIMDEKQAGKHSSGVSPVNTNDEGINALIIAAIKINSIRPALMNPYIPIKQGLRNTFAFQCLLNIRVTPRLTKTAYARSFNTSKHSTYHAIDYLMELGLVSELGKPRLIIPFHRFKIDKGYRITPKGNNVIEAVLKEAGLI